MTFDNKIPFPEVPFAARQHHNTVRLKMHFKHNLIFFFSFQDFFSRENTPGIIVGQSERRGKMKKIVERTEF